VLRRKEDPTAGGGTAALIASPSSPAQARALGALPPGRSGRACGARSGSWVPSQQTGRSSRKWPG